MLLLKGHRADNDYDGYDPHHHMMLLDMTLSEYEENVAGIGNVYPGTAYQAKILDPHSLEWVRGNLRVVGYDWLEPVEPQHSSYYAWYGRHDGVDVAPFSGGPGEYVGTYYSGYTNGNGYHASADLYRLVGEVQDEGNRTPWMEPQAQEPQPTYEVTGEGTTTRSKFWGRKYRVLVGTGDDTALNVSDLRCSFIIEKTIMTQPNLSVVTIYNLSPDTEAKLVKQGMRVIVEAGYESQDQYGLIFDGSVVGPSRGKEDQTTYFLTLQGLDGSDWINYGVVTESLTRGQPVRSIADACIKASVPVETGTITQSMPETLLIRGRVLFGRAVDMLMPLAKLIGAALYVEDGRINLIAAPDIPPGEIFSLDATSGLIGFPQQTQLGISARSLLNPRLKLNDLVYLNNEQIRQSQLTLGQYIRPLASSGIYRIIKLTHRGDTRGNDWYTDIEAVAQDQFNPY